MDKEYECFISYLYSLSGAKCTIFTHEAGFEYMMRVDDLPLEIINSNSVDIDILRIGNRKCQFVDVTRDNFKRIIVYTGDRHLRCNDEQ